MARSRVLGWRMQKQSRLWFIVRYPFWKNLTPSPIHATTQLPHPFLFMASGIPPSRFSLFVIWQSFHLSTNSCLRISISFRNVPKIPFKIYHETFRWINSPPVDHSAAQPTLDAPLPTKAIRYITLFFSDNF